MVYILSYFLPLAFAACAAIKTSTLSTRTSANLAAPPTCNNQGIQWAYYTNNQGTNNGNFQPDFYKTQSPVDYGVTYGVGVSYPYNGGKNITIYNSSKQVSPQFFALDHRAFIYAPQTGLYNFSVSAVDDSAFFWLGNSALSGWNRANTMLFATYNGGPGANWTQVTMTEGQYYPFRVMFAQAQWDAAFSMSITAPDGSTLLNSGTTVSNYLLQYSCVNQYPPFGQET